MRGKKSIAKADVDLLNCTKQDKFVFVGLELSQGRAR